MSNFKTKKGQAVTDSEMTSNLAATLASLQGGEISDGLAKDLVSLESFDGTSFENVKLGFESVHTHLVTAGLENYIRQQVTNEAADGTRSDLIDERVSVAMEAATLAAMALGDAETAQKAILSTGSAPDKAIAIDTYVPGVVTATPDMQAFHTQSFNNWRAETVRMAALNAVNSEFLDAFFKTRVMEPGQHGQIVEIKVPYAYTRTRRAANGKAFEGPEKISLLRASEDPHLLEDFSTTIFPNGAAAANNDDYLVDPTVIGNESRTIHGEVIETRPLVFGKEIDLLGVSNHPGLLGSAVQTDTDTIESNVNLGHLYLQAAIDDGASNVTNHIFKLDVSSMAGALFTPVAEGSNQSLTMNFKNVVGINSKMQDIAKATTFKALIDAHLGLSGEDWTIGVQVNLSGNASSEYGNIEVYQNGALKLDRIYTDVNPEEPVVGAERTAIETNVTFSLIGYMPKARRTNVTLRQDGYLLDEGTTNRYYFGLQTGAPVSSTRPVSAPGGASTLDALRRGLRVVSTGNGFNALFAAEEAIKQAHATGVLAPTASTIGGLYVKPYYYEDTIDLQNHIAVQRSGLGYDDARGLLIDAVTAGVDSMLLKSGYLTALENFDGAEREYEVVIGTDPRIAGMLMRSGDSRTLGEGRKFRVVHTMHKAIRDKIYITFRRPTQDGIDAMSFGAHLYKAPLVHDVQNAAHNNGVLNKIQAQPVELYTYTLPIIGIINVAGVEEFFKRA